MVYVNATVAILKLRHDISYIDKIKNIPEVL